MKNPSIVLIILLFTMMNLWAEPIGEKKSRKEEFRSNMSNLLLKQHVGQYMKYYQKHFGDLVERSKNTTTFLKSFPPKAKEYYLSEFKGVKRLPKITQKGFVVHIEDQDLHVVIHPVPYYWGVVKINGRNYQLKKSGDINEIKQDLLKKAFPQTGKKVTTNFFVSDAYAEEAIETTPILDPQGHGNLVAAVVAMSFYKHLLDKGMLEAEASADRLGEAFKEYYKENFEGLCNYQILQEVVNLKNKCVGYSQEYKYDYDTLEGFIAREKHGSRTYDEERKLMGVLMSLLHAKAYPIEYGREEYERGARANEVYQDDQAGKVHIFLYGKAVGGYGIPMTNIQFGGYRDIRAHYYDVSGNFLKSKFVTKTDQMFIDKFRDKDNIAVHWDWNVDKCEDKGDASTSVRSFVDYMTYCDGLAIKPNGQIVEYPGRKWPPGTENLSAPKFCSILEELETCLAPCLNDPNCQDKTITDVHRASVLEKGQAKAGEWGDAAYQGTKSLIENW